MLIRNFPSCKETIDDINNIVEKRRYIIFFIYDGPHKTMNATYNGADNNYDIYLINESVTYGNNFIIPKGIKLFNRNGYRGVVRNPFNENGTINKRAIIQFFNGTYSNTIHKENGDIFRVSTPTVMECGDLGGTSIEDELMICLNSQYIQPFPKYYNIEDQGYFEKIDNYKVGDFLYDYTSCPMYNLGDLIDPYTVFAKISIPMDNQLVKRGLLNPYTMEEICSSSDLDPNVTFKNGVSLDLGELKERITRTFLDIHKFVMGSIFSQVDVIIDMVDSTFKVVEDTIKLKYMDISKDQIRKEYLRLVININELTDNMFGEMDVPSSSYEMCPDRLTIHISNGDCRVKLSNTRTRNKQFVATGISSSSDADEILTLTLSELGY